MNITPKLGLALLAAGLYLAVPRAWAQTNLTKVDAKFLQDAAQGGMTEVKLGELAVKNGASEEVKEFGRMMIKDHQLMNEKLKTLAANKSVPISADLDEKHQAVVDKLSKEPATGFDDSYIIEMIKDHQADAKDFKEELAATQDVDIQNFLTKSIPVVEAHLKHVAGLQKAPVNSYPEEKKVNQ